MFRVPRARTVEAECQNIHMLLRITIVVVKKMNFNNLSGKHRKWSVFATTEANLLNFSWYCRMSGFKSVHLQMRTFLSQKHPILKFYSNDASTFPINISFMQY